MISNDAAVSGTGSDSVSIVADSVNTFASVTSALSAVTSLSVFQCFHRNCASLLRVRNVTIFVFNMKPTVDYTETCV